MKKVMICLCFILLIISASLVYLVTGTDKKIECLVGVIINSAALTLWCKE